jgi:hypothetical protein
VLKVIIVLIMKQKFNNSGSLLGKLWPINHIVAAKWPFVLQVLLLFAQVGGSKNIQLGDNTWPQRIADVKYGPEILARILIALFGVDR